MNQNAATSELSLRRRTLLRYGGAIAGTAVCGFPALVRAANVELLIGGPASAEKPFRDFFFDPFEKATGVKIYYEGTNSATNLTKLRAEKASPKRSLVFMDDVVLMTAMDENLLTSLPATIANLKDVVPRCIGINRFWTNYMVMKSGVAINTKDGKPISSWNDLWQPAAKGRVIVPALTITEALWVLIMASSLKSGKPLKEAQFDIDSGFAKMKELKPNLLTIYNNAPQALDLLMQGEAWYIGGQFSQNVLRFQEMGRPIGFAKVKEGGFAMPQSVAMVAGAPHLDAAAKLVDFILATDVQNKLSEILYSAPVNTKAKVAAKFAAELPDAAAMDKELFLPDWDNIRKNRPQWIQRWEREIAN